MVLLPNHILNQLKGLVKVPLFCVKQRFCKHCFKNEWTLSLIFLPSWKRLLLQTTTDGQVAVKCIAKTFASGKTEKLVYDTLASLELPSEKVKIRKIITNKTQKSNSWLFVWYFCTSRMLFEALSVMGFEIIIKTGFKIHKYDNSNFKTHYTLLIKYPKL